MFVCKVRGVKKRLANDISLHSLSMGIQPTRRFLLTLSSLIHVFNGSKYSRKAVAVIFVNFIMVSGLMISRHGFEEPALIMSLKKKIYGKHLDVLYFFGKYRSELYIKILPSRFNLYYI